MKQNHTELDQSLDQLLSRLTLKEKIALLSGNDVWNTVPIPRLGIQALTMTDGTHGVRANFSEGGRTAGPTTAFPTGVSIAASWDPHLVEQVGVALGEETLGMGCNILLGPCVNIVRHPITGRNFESYGEDPYLSGQIGVAFVQGVQSQGVGASLKHFACNNQEVERMRGNSIVDERTLREIYLAQFETIVKKARPWTVMCSYNRINGEYASQNHHTLTEILREEWGYEGAVISDWSANHTIFESVAAGLDLEMPGPAKYYGGLLLEAVSNWQIAEADIDRAARQVLRLLAKAGKISQVSPSTAGPGSVNTPQHQALARKLAEESITLLKNEGSVLPLFPEKIKSLAVIGMNAAQYTISGGGSAIVTPPYVVSPLQGLKTRLGKDVAIRFEPGCNNFDRIPALCPDWLQMPDGSGAGLLGEYFNNTHFEGQPAMVRPDRKIDFWWFSQGPVSSLKFSVRWTGRMVVPETGRYALQLTNSSVCRLYIEDQLVVENQVAELTSFQPFSSSKYFTFEAGRSYPFRVEYAKDSDEPFAQVSLQGAWMPLPEEDSRLARALEAASSSDAAIVFAGMPELGETEGKDRPHLHLPGKQDELIQAIVHANPKTIVVLNVGSPVSMPWLSEVPAVVLSYFGGLEVGNAIARVLVGDVNPSGKLPVTFPSRLEDTPAFGNYPGGKEVRYCEGIFVGYRHYDLKDIDPLFPFGHGLSYTSFAYSHLQVPSSIKAGEAWQVSVNVQNTGLRAGQEVVQLYIHDVKSSLPRPLKELKGFKKITLQPGEVQEVKFDLDDRSLSFYDPEAHQWTVEPGEFEILAASSSRDIRAVAKVAVTKR
ncbi:MAG TPA: glycoside hydrolase family 3 C-terminal domain-containing protein [Anaerolineaceae bacterium]